MGVAQVQASHATPETGSPRTVAIPTIIPAPFELFTVASAIVLSIDLFAEPFTISNQYWPIYFIAADHRQVVLYSRPNRPCRIPKLAKRGPLRLGEPFQKAR